MNHKTQTRVTRRSLPSAWLMAVFPLLYVSVLVAAEEPTVTSPAVSRSVAAPADASPWQRIVMIGASATAGFTASEPLGGTNTLKFSLSRYVDAAITAAHEPVKNLGNAFFFFQPELIGRQQITRALTNHPTLIIGLDFPFWFCYGEGATDEARLQRFEQGLKLLENISCPLVLGDLPDASAAVNKMLRPEQMPSPQAIAAANQRLKTWAAGRKNVGLVALSDFMRKALANQPITIREYTLPEGQTRMLIQGDYLHPSPRGCSVLALAVLDAAQAIGTTSRADDFLNDPKAIFQKVAKPTASAGNSAPVSQALQ